MSKKLSLLIKLIRYRFLLFAGILPFILGAAVAFHFTKIFYPSYFLIALVGLILVLIGVEAFNEYFDFKIGTDRVFLESYKEVPKSTFIIGIFAFALAFIIAVYLTLSRGWQVMLFSLLGFLAAAFYVGPPIKLAYRGLGELVICLAYGPLMTTGSYYVQTQKIDCNPIIASLLPCFFILALTLINEIPDYYGDRLVGKRNIVVRVGREKAIIFYQILLLFCYIMVASGIILKKLPILSLLIFITLPLAYKNILIAKKHYDYPQSFIPAIRGTIFLYTVAISLLIISYFLTI